ncbi:hypothetical protein Fcan01_00931 [Folsomia candida]|uniref:Uncharacterized protein n=1 Tax=Folsomia candida TaxID=158441 RepID=A0A226F5Q5_FOLCA|nr:hypothetical protein Fcan01_00931 [Folsomia candida]
MLIRSLLANTSLQTLTPFDALQRCTKFSEWLYPQRLTFDRVTWEPTPTPTPRSKLIPWYFLSILCAIWETSFVFILLQQLLSHKKDSEILMPTYVLLLSCCICYTLSTTICCAYHFNPEELCFVIRNMLRIKGPSNESSNLTGFYLHGIITFSITIPLAIFVVMILRPKFDPTYLLLRNVTMISSEMKDVGQANFN